jgi:hypothetical protein
MKDTTIHVATVLGKFEAIDAEDGQQVYDHILKAFFQSKRVILAFDNMEVLSEEFLQTSVGQLYQNYSHAEIKKNMRIDNISFSGKIALKRIVDKARESY